MNITLRPITPDEFPAFHRATGRGFGETVTDQDIELGRLEFDIEGSLAAFDGDRIAGTGVLFPLSVTVPGNRQVRAGGVSWITVQPDYRRQGILTAMMQRQFADVRQRGEAVTLLYASESAIYGRFGYGMATRSATLSIDTRHGQLSHAPEITGRVRLVEKDEATRVLPEVYERCRVVQPGAITKPSGWWEAFFADPENHRNGASQRYYAVYESGAGAREGYVAYRVVSKWENGFAAGTVRVVSFLSESPEARAALWRYLLSIDLVTKVEAGNLPIDEPLRFMLADPRRLQTTQFGDGLWVRIVDVPAALAARAYGERGDLVLEVRDSFLPENSGRYRLSADPDGARCERTDAEPDLSLGIADLGAVYLGGTRMRTLAQAGRAREMTPGAVARATRLFLGDVVPWTSEFF